MRALSVLSRAFVRSGTHTGGEQAEPYDPVHTVHYIRYDTHNTVRLGPLAFQNDGLFFAIGESAKSGSIG
jgi:hypothetical protein